MNREEILNYTGKRDASLTLLESVDSTNEYIKRNAENFSSRSVVISEEQTAGKGRIGRNFLSKKGGIYLSYLVKPEKITFIPSKVTAVVAVALRRAIFNAVGVTADIKWVNDLLVGGKKICGILCESVFDGTSDNKNYLVIGVGVNANQRAEAFGELQNKATSLFEITKREVALEKLTAEIIKELDKIGFEGALPAEYLEEYVKYNVSVGKRISIERNGTEKTGVSIGITPDFSLSVRYDDGTSEDISFGEVSVRGY